MKKAIIIYGVIAGAVVSGMLVITIPLYERGILDLGSGELVGYTTMIIALSMIFFGIKTHRDHYLGGGISFGQGFKTGILITLIASLIYVAVWEVCYHTIAKNFTDLMAGYYLENVKESGASETELANATREMETFKQTYNNPFIRMGYTFIEIFPVGFIITLLSAAILRKKVN